MHAPVLKKEVLEALDPKPNENFIDCTINGGGHAAAILEKNGPRGKVLGIETDRELYRRLNSQIVERLILVNDSYANLKEIIKKNNFGPINGILFDLGMSSWHLEESSRGFTFQKYEPLDMRYNTSQELTAEKIINKYSQEEIERILKEYGEERFSKRIAKKIIENRPIKTTFDLVKIINQAIPRRQIIHPATRTFQALRIAVNQELDSLEKALPQAEEILAPGGRLAVISFHSLEDRIAKNFFKRSGLKILTKKPIIPSEQEIKQNLRSRSSKLRAGIKQ
ncbi:MAG: 16S rRNA (cytosine(1402)-N(4))-methyltransferase RsmH [bacterium]|nr:16S rRNA (cytosine(1402)-N(4))-methyltransferase RsmH [bacterium]